MALFDINVDDVDTVLAIRTRALELLKEGAATMQWTSEGTSVSKQFVLPVSEVLQETLDYLREYDPDLYGKQIKRMSPYYY